MYTEGIKVGNNSYILSDEDGTLTLLKSKGTPEEIEEYINLKNTYEEERDYFSSLQDDLSKIYEKERASKSANIEIFLSIILIEGLFTFILGFENMELIESIKVLSIPLIATLACIGVKTLIYGTKKTRTKQKEEINEILTRQKEKLKDLEKQINKLKRNIETESLFWEDEIIPVTTEENKKANVKMRVLKLEQNR